MTKFIERIYDVIMSIYLYNEFTGYTELDRLLDAIKIKYPEEREFIQAVQKHADDERKHYLMFRSYFKKLDRMPFMITSTYGYIDLFINHIFGKPIEALISEDVIKNEQQFFQLCRLIMMTEFRGMKQVNTLLNNQIIKRNQAIVKIFRVIERDEPSHCFPYQLWLEKWGSHLPHFKERITDLWIHYSITLIKAPLLFFNFRLKRLEDFYA